MIRAFVTGASGAVGYGLIKALIDADVSVTVLGRSEPLEKDKVGFIFCDLADLKTAEFDFTADMFFHLAWNGTYGNERNDENAQFKNVEYTLDAVRLAKKLGCKSFVGVGSQAEYGAVPYGVKLMPELECSPQNFYGKAKLEACKKAGALCRELGIKFNWCRIVSAYGIGDKPYTMIMSTIAKMTDGEPCAFTPCEQVWDYISNEDLGRAILKIAQNGREGKIYVAGSGEGLPLREYVLKICNAVGNGEARCNFGALPYFENQPMYLCADISELTSDTGFAPEIPFDEGIRKTVEWFKNNKSED